MTHRLARRLLAAGSTLALALPGVAAAHGTVHGHHHHHHAAAHLRLWHHRDACARLDAGRAPASLTADQVTALQTACTTRDAAIKAANDAFRATVKPADQAYRAALKAARADVRTAAQARRTACAPDPTAQACADARASFRATLKADRQKVRDAAKAWHDVVRPAAKTRNAAVRAARQAFREQVAKILGA